MSVNLDRLRQIAQYQQETGCRVEYDAGTILALLDQIELEQARKDFLRRWFANEREWADDSIDESIRLRKEKGFD